MRKFALLLVVILCLSGMDVQASVSVPTGHGPVPNQRQLAWQKLERIAFIHFGMNTFTNAEWGTGNENPNIFNPTSEYNPEQWAKELKENGFELVILTAKHHDGFCLWPSAYTTHDVASSSWKSGQGDVLKDLSEACEKYNLKLGLYLSPWDRHEPSYGQGDAYNQYMENQITEVLTNYGPIYEMWFDGAKGEGVDQDYDKESWFELIHELQPNCIVWGSPGEVRWTGNEHGFGGDPCWAKSCSAEKAQELGLTYEQRVALRQHGHPEGDIWYPPEADVSIRPGWFYHSSQDDDVKDLSKLVDVYKKSVGRNNVLLLNVPVDKRGLFHDNDVARLREFNDWVVDSFANNLAIGSTITTSNTRGNSDTYAGDKVIDGDFDTYWATDDDVNTANMIIDFGTVKTFNTVMLQEYIALGQRVEGFAVDVWKNNEWVTIDTKTTIGYKRILTLPNQSSSKVRIRVIGSQACPLISEVGIYMVGHIDDYQDPQKNYALGKNVVVSNVHSPSYSGEKAVDGALETRWATSDNTTSCSIEIDFWEPVTFNKLYLKQLQKRIGDYTIEYFNGQEWVQGYSGSQPEAENNIIFEALTGNKMRLNILNIVGNLGPSIYEIGVFYEEQETPKTNIVLNKPVIVSNYHSSPYTGNKAIDDSTSTRWATSDAIVECWLEVDLEGNKTFDSAHINQLQTRIGDYKIEYYNGSEWLVAYEGNNPAQIEDITFESVQGDKVRLHIYTRNGNLGPSIYEFQVQGY